MRHLATATFTERIINEDTSNYLPAGYGGPADAEARTNSIRDFKRELRARPIAGDVYTQATNIEDERNGLIGIHSGELDVLAGLLRSEEPGQPG